MRKILAILLLAGVPALAGAIDESSYPTEYYQTVRPWFESVRTTGSLVTPDGRTLGWIAVEAAPERGAVVVLPGWTEQAETYVELLYDLRSSGYSFFLLDHRGQGLSQGDYPSRDRWYVADWHSFLSDLDLFMDRVVRTKAHGATIFYGFSMGGAIAAAYLGAHPGAADGMILVSPMFRINTAPLPISVMSAISGVMTFFGCGTAYLPGNGHYRRIPFAGNPSRISSSVRYAERLRLEDIIEAYRPGGITAKGGLELLRLSRYALRNANKIAIPALIIEAGNDRTVRNDITDRAVREMANARTAVIPGANHVMMLETDAPRNAAIAAVSRFLTQW